MGLGQTMLTAGFIVILTVIVLNANKMILDSEEAFLSGEALKESADIGEALIGEVLRKKFDHKAVDTYYQYSSEFTSAASLGPETGETISPKPDREPFQSIWKYNDIDDYNGYQRIVDTPSISGFVVSCRVYYVTNTDFETMRTSQTYFKRLIVTVEHPSYLKPVLLSAIITY